MHNATYDEFCHKCVFVEHVCRHCIRQGPNPQALWGPSFPFPACLLRLQPPNIWPLQGPAFYLPVTASVSSTL